MQKYFEKFGHTCEFDVDEEFKKFLKGKSRVEEIIIKYTTIDPVSSLTLQHFNSHSAITNERKFHLENHPKTIHPFSKFKFIWECSMVLVFLCGLIYSPLQYLDYVDKDEDTNIGNINFMILIKSICLIDMALRFFIGDHDERNFTVNCSNIFINIH